MKHKYIALGVALVASNIAFADDSKNQDVKQLTVCSCETTVSDIDKKIEKSKKDVKHSEEEYKRIEEDNNSSEFDIEDAKNAVDQAKEDEKSSEKELEHLKEEKNKSKYGTCVCPNGNTSYYVKTSSVNSVGGSTTSSFREVRGQ